MSVGFALPEGQSNNVFYAKKKALPRQILYRTGRPPGMSICREDKSRFVPNPVGARSRVRVGSNSAARSQQAPEGHRGGLVVFGVIIADRN